MITESSTIRLSIDPTIPETTCTANGPALQHLIESEWRELGQVDLVSSLQRHPDLLRERSVLMNLAVEEFRSRRNISEIHDLPQYCVRFREFGGSIERSILRQLEAQRYVDDNLADLFSEPRWPTVGESFGHFTIVEELGRGSLARVYRCLQRDLGNRTVVVKAASYSDAEASILGRLNHPNIIPVFSTGFVEGFGLHFICMPYCGSSTLSDLIDVAFEEGIPRRDNCTRRAAIRWTMPEGRLGPSRDRHHLWPWQRTYIDCVVRLASQIAAALDHGHRQGVLHGDLKPSNVLLTPSGNPLLLDYNLSQDYASSLRRCGGTLPYMPPEHLRLVVQPASVAGESEINPASDVYSFGALLYELLTGGPPVTVPNDCTDPAEVAQSFVKQLSQGVAPVRSINPLAGRRLESLTLRCLAFQPADRPRSMSDIQRELEAEQRSLASLARRIRVYPLAFSLLSALVLALALGTTVYIAMQPPAHVAAYQRAVELADSGRTEDATYYFNKSLEAEPTFAEARYARARAHLRQGQIDLAMTDFFELSRSGHSQAMAFLAYCFNLNGSDAAAITWYERAKKHRANTVAVYNNLGASYIAAKTHHSLTERMRLAHENLTKAFELDNHSAIIRLNLVRLATAKALADRSYNPIAVWQIAVDLLESQSDNLLVQNHLSKWYRVVLRRNDGPERFSNRQELLDGHVQAALQAFEELRPSLPVRDHTVDATDSEGLVDKRPTPNSLFLIEPF